MTDTTKNILLFIGGVIWSMKSAQKAYAPPLTTTTFKPNNDFPNTMGQDAPTSQEDCEDGKVFKPEKQIEVNCIMAPCPPMNIPAQCITPLKDRVTSNQALRNKVGNWTPNDTSCTPCTTNQYQGNRATARIHKSWCDLNSAVEMRKANQHNWGFAVPFQKPVRR